MTEHLVRLIISHGLALAFGLATGEFFRFRKKGNRVVMEVEAKEVWRRVVKQVAWVVVVVMFLASVAQSVLFTYSQRECNTRVVDTLNYRSQLADSDRDLIDARENATFKMVTDLLAVPATVPQEPHVPGSGTGPPTSGSGTAVRDVLETFVKERERIDTEAAKIDKERKANPLPKCGD